MKSNRQNQGIQLVRYLRSQDMRANHHFTRVEDLQKFNTSKIKTERFTFQNKSQLFSELAFKFLSNLLEPFLDSIPTAALKLNSSDVQFIQCITDPDY